MDSIEVASGAKWYDLGRHAEYGKSTVRGQLRLRIKLVQHNVKEDKCIARARRLGTKMSKTTKTTATASHSGPAVVESTARPTGPAAVAAAAAAAAAKQPRKRKTTSNKKQNKVIHHKLDWSHVKSKTDSHHEGGAGMDQAHLSRHEQLRMAQQQFRRQQHQQQASPKQNKNNRGNRGNRGGGGDIVIGESSFPVTHNIDLSMEESHPNNYQDHSDYHEQQQEQEEYYNDRRRDDERYMEEDDADAADEYYNSANDNEHHQGKYEQEESYYNNQQTVGMLGEDGHQGGGSRGGGMEQHDMDTLMNMYYQGGERTMSKLPTGRLGLNDLMELQTALESRDNNGEEDEDGGRRSSPLRAAARSDRSSGSHGSHGGNDERSSVLPHVLPHTLDAQEDDDTYEQNVRALEREYQRLGGATTT